MKKALLSLTIGLALSSSVFAQQAQNSPENQTSSNTATTEQNVDQTKNQQKDSIDLAARKKDLNELIKKNDIKTFEDLNYFLSKQNNSVMFSLEQKQAEQKLQAKKERDTANENYTKALKDIMTKKQNLEAQLAELNIQHDKELLDIKERSTLNQNYMDKIKEATENDLKTESDFIKAYYNKPE